MRQGIRILRLAAAGVLVGVWLLGVAGCTADEPSQKTPVAPVATPKAKPEPSPARVDSGSGPSSREAGATAEPGSSGGAGKPKVLSLTLSPAKFYAGDELTLVPEVNAAEGQSLELRYAWFINDVPYDFARGETLPGDAFVRGDRIAVEVLPVVDGEEGYVFRSDDIVVPNAAPRITSDPASGTIAGDIYTFRVTAEDADGDELTYTMKEAPAGMSVESESGLVSWNIASEESKTYGFTLAADDGHGGTATQRVQISLDVTREGGR